ncbi:MAG: carbon starvation CstA family protein [Candidatus Zixiibacteriota bacterium]
MNILLLLGITLTLFYLGVRFYSRYVSDQIGSDDARVPPSLERSDGVDYVPTRPYVVFAHHFSTIAGAGPIIGPTLAILFGFMPAWLWIVFGTILIGAVHDYTALFASMREGGRSMSQIAARTLGRDGFALFILFTILMIVLVTSAFLKLTAMSLTSMWPLADMSLAPDQTLLRTVMDGGVEKAVIGGIASTSVIIITLFAPIIGFLICKRQLRTICTYLLAAAVCIGSIYLGFKHPVTLSPNTWMIIMSVYTFVAAGIPVWIVLQPRDFTNVQILYGGMAFLAVLVIVAGLGGAVVRFPSFNVSEGAQHLGLIWPMLFITVACGAISGFHCLVSSGTTSKQISSEGDARRIGYNGMVLEGVLATLVLLAIGAGLDSSDYMGIVWNADEKSNPILAFALSVGNLSHSVFPFISVALGSVFGILMIEGFVVTTLDSAVRLNRYLFEELWTLIWGEAIPTFMRKYWFNSGLSVILMFLLGYFNAFTLIWPIFGSANQLLAALSLIAVSVWLYWRGKKNWFTLLPAVFMIVTTLASLVFLLFDKYMPEGNVALIVTDLLLIALSLGVVVLSARMAYSLYSNKLSGTTKQS